MRVQARLKAAGHNGPDQVLTLLPGIRASQGETEVQGVWRQDATR